MPALRVQIPQVFTWGGDGERVIGPKLVPADFREPWSSLRGEHIFEFQMPGFAWEELDLNIQRYFDEWADKCRRYEQSTSILHEKTLSQLGHFVESLADETYPLLDGESITGAGGWIAKTVNSRTFIGFLTSDYDDDLITDGQHWELAVHWLPQGGDRGCTEILFRGDGPVNPHGMSLGEWGWGRILNSTPSDPLSSLFQGYGADDFRICQMLVARN